MRHLHLFSRHFFFFFPKQCTSKDQKTGPENEIGSYDLLITSAEVKPTEPHTSESLKFMPICLNVSFSPKSGHALSDPLNAGIMWHLPPPPLPPCWEVQRQLAATGNSRGILGWVRHGSAWGSDRCPAEQRDRPGLHCWWQMAGTISPLV